MSNFSYLFAKLPAASAFPGMEIFVSDVGSTGTFFKSNGTIWKPLNPIIWQGGGPFSHTGDTNAVQLVSQLIPPGLMTANSALRITTLWDFPNSANNKTMKVQLSSTTGTAGAGTSYLSQVVTAFATNSVQTNIRNANATNAQVGFSSSGNSYSISGGSKVTSALDFTGNVYVNIEAQLASAAETINMEYSIELLIP